MFFVLVLLLYMGIGGGPRGKDGMVGMERHMERKKLA